MTVTTTATTARRAGAMKLVASAGVLAAGVAVAGLGTFGGFTDSVTPVDTSVETGVVSIDIAAAGNVFFDGSNLRPGDSRSQLLDLVNTGNTALGTVTMTTGATRSSVLDTDRTNGLQLQVQSCSVRWQGERCTGELRELYAGPFVVSGHVLADAASATPGKADHLRMVGSLPATASDPAFQGRTSTLTLAFGATARAGAAR